MVLLPIIHKYWLFKELLKNPSLSQSTDVSLQLEWKQTNISNKKKTF